MKTVLITGDNKGIGFDSVKQIGQRIYYVCAGSRDAPKDNSLYESVNNIQAFF